MSYPNKITKTIPEFEYSSPSALSDAVSLLARTNGKAKVLAGGTDVLLLMKQRAIAPEYVINIKGIADLAYIREDEGGVKIGPLTTITMLEGSKLIKEKYISIYEATKKFATPPIRNMATIGGNICRSSPSADMVPPLMVLGAVLKLIGSKGEREVLIEDFFTGPGTNVLKQELLREIVIPKGKGRCGSAFGKVMRNSGDLAKVNCAVKMVITDGKCEDIRIALGAVSAKPIRAKNAESILRGKKISDALIEDAAEKVGEDIKPITDVRSTVDYRTEVSKVLVRRVIKLSAERIG
jgi:aerobic carbon-monoxide dehydrogenase medium subunit